MQFSQLTDTQQNEVLEMAYFVVQCPELLKKFGEYADISDEHLNDLAVAVRRQVNGLNAEVVPETATELLAGGFRFKVLVDGVFSSRFKTKRRAQDYAKFLMGDRTRVVKAGD